MLNVALVGLGYWGSKLAHAVTRTPGASLRWLVEADQELLDQHVRDFPLASGSNDLSEVLGDADVDAVVIATPASTHVNLAAESLLSGKHVFVEKPLALSVGDSESIVRMASERKKTLMVGHTFLYNEAVLQAKKLIDGGDLGAVQYLNFVRTNLGPLRADTSVLWDLATHDVSMALWLIGEQPTSVTAVGQAWINPGREDFATVWLHFPKNVVAQISVSWLSPERLRKFNIVGDAAMLSVDDANQATPLVLHSKFVSQSRAESGGTRLEHVDKGSVLLDFNWSEPLVNQLREFVQVCDSAVPPRSDGVFGVSVVKVLEAAEKSMNKNGAPVEIV